MDRGAWWAAVHGVAKSRTRLSDFTFTFHFHALEKEMATHSSVLAWRIPGSGEPGGLLSVGSHRVRHDWSDLATAAGASLVVQWLRFHTFNAGDVVRSGVGELRSSIPWGVDKIYVWYVCVCVCVCVWEREREYIKGHVKIRYAFF